MQFKMTDEDCTDGSVGRRKRTVWGSTKRQALEGKFL